MPLVFLVAASVKSLTNPLGLYLHIPFCKGKCAYCDFYSVFVNDRLLDNYTQALIREIKQWGGNINRPIDTIYLGGGTPSLLARRLPKVLEAVKNSFSVTENAEITLEMNPEGDTEKLLEYAIKAGVNRLSIGAQSSNDEELAVLGRKHTAKDTVNAVNTARRMGFKNISLDIMLGLPHSDIESLEKNLKFITDLNPEHISAYILKVEENTLFYKKQAELNLPDDDLSAEQYLQMCEYLKNKGYSHYEISNFAKAEFQSRHNLKYWNLEDYLGIGPAAHSCVEGKRFYYPRNLKAFISGNTPIPDGDGGTKEEYIMLALRTNKGINLQDFGHFGLNLSEQFLKKCEIFEKNGLLVKTDDRIFLTDTGMLLSNSIITELLECIA